MLATTMEGRMARKRTKSAQPKRDDTAVKFDRTLADKARLVASRSGTTMGEYLSNLCRDAIERDFARVIREMEAK